MNFLKLIIPGIAKKYVIWTINCTKDRRFEKSTQLHIVSRLDQGRCRNPQDRVDEVWDRKMEKDTQVSGDKIGRN